LKIAVILAGGKVDPDSPFWPLTKGASKAMIEIHGKLMIQWILDAINQVESIEAIYLVGADPKTDLNSSKAIHFLPDKGGIVENVTIAGESLLRDYPDTERFLALGSDIPLITGDIIEKVIRGATPEGYHIYYNFIEQQTMEASMPGVRRTYTRFKDGRFCGGDICVISTKTVIHPILKKLVAQRKKPLRMILTFGIGALLRMMFFRPSLKGAARIVKRRIGISVYPVVSEITEIATDIDTLEHLTYVQKRLSN